MTDENAIALQEQLIRLELGDQAGELYMNRNNPQKEFSIVWSAQKGWYQTFMPSKNGLFYLSNNDELQLR